MGSPVQSELTNTVVQHELFTINLDWADCVNNNESEVNKTVLVDQRCVEMWCVVRDNDIATRPTPAYRRAHVRERTDGCSSITLASVRALSQADPMCHWDTKKQNELVTKVIRLSCHTPIQVYGVVLRPSALMCAVLDGDIDAACRGECGGKKASRGGDYTTFCAVQSASGC